MVTALKAIEALKTTQMELVTVCFGNVLGSNGTLIPLLKNGLKQMAQ